MGVKTPLDEHILEQFGHRNVIVDVPEGPGIHGTDGQPFGKTVHIVQLEVAVHRGDHRGAAEQLDQKTCDVGFCAMTVDQVGLFLAHQPDEPEIVIGHEPGKQGLCPDADRLCRIREVTAAETDQRQIIALLQSGTQGKNMSLCAAAVTAAGNVEYFHTRNLLVSICIHNIL